MKNDLKPCPFCGGKPYQNECDREYKIVCDKCRVRTDTYSLSRLAVEAWNRRVNDE